MIHHVEFTDRARRDMRKLPPHIVDHVLEWASLVRREGLEMVRRRPGYHDEPLHGDMRGFRSIRLSRAYRAYYRIINETAEFVSVERIDKHEY